MHPSGMPGGRLTRAIECARDGRSRSVQFMPTAVPFDWIDTQSILVFGLRWTGQSFLVPGFVLSRANACVSSRGAGPRTRLLGKAQLVGVRRFPRSGRDLGDGLDVVPVTNPARLQWGSSNVSRLLLTAFGRGPNAFPLTGFRAVEPQGPPETGSRASGAPVAPVAGSLASPGKPPLRAPTGQSEGMHPPIGMHLYGREAGGLQGRVARRSPHNARIALGGDDRLLVDFAFGAPAFSGPRLALKYHEDARLSRDDETHKNLPAIRCAMSRGSARHHRSSPQGPLGRNGSGVAKTRRGGKGTEEQTGQSRSRDRPRRLTPQSFRDFICSKSRFTQWPSARKTPRPSGGGASWGCEVWGT
jgi:hypothetical protein